MRLRLILAMIQVSITTTRQSHRITIPRRGGVFSVDRGFKRYMMGAWMLRRGSEMLRYCKDTAELMWQYTTLATRSIGLAGVSAPASILKPLDISAWATPAGDSWINPARCRGVMRVLGGGCAEQAWASASGLNSPRGCRREYGQPLARIPLWGCASMIAHRYG